MVSECTNSSHESPNGSTWVDVQGHLQYLGWPNRRICDIPKCATDQQTSPEPPLFTSFYVPLWHILSDNLCFQHCGQVRSVKMSCCWNWALNSVGWPLGAVALCWGFLFSDRVSLRLSCCPWDPLAQCNYLPAWWFLGCYKEPAEDAKPTIQKDIWSSALHLRILGSELC